MKVIYILDTFPKISETFILNEILEMQKKGIVIEIYAFSKANEDKFHSGVINIKKIEYCSKLKMIEELRYHIYLLLTRPINYLKTLLFSLNRKNQVLKLFLSKLSFMLLIVKARPDHIHAHFGHRTSSMAMLIKLLYGVPFTFTTHRYDIFDTPPRNYRIKSELAKKHVTISEYNKQYMVTNFGVEETDIEVIHCGVDFNRKFPLADSKGRNVIISIARLEKHKGLDNLIKACLELKRHNFKFQCLIVGEGSYKSELNKLICDCGLTKEVELLGSKTQDKVFDLLSKAKIGVLPSRSEGIPVSLMEAMACRVPAIGPDVNGVSELIEDGKCGFLVPPDNINMLVEKIKILLTDENLRTKFIENGYEKVFKEFNLERETDKLLKIWGN